MPIGPNSPPVMRIRSLPSVEKTIGLLPPELMEMPLGFGPTVASDSEPSVAVIVMLPVLEMAGVMTPVPAVTVVPAVMALVTFTPVKEPAARVVAPMVTPLMLPPVRSTRLERNMPSVPLMMARTLPSVTKRRSLSLVVPRKLPTGA